LWRGARGGGIFIRVGLWRADASSAGCVAWLTSRLPITPGNLPSTSRHLYLHDRRADSYGVADFGAEPGDGSFDRRGDLDGRLVGHHSGEDGVLAHQVADFDVPLDEFCLGNAFADIRHLDDEFGHAHASITCTSASPTRFGPGK